LGIPKLEELEMVGGLGQTEEEAEPEDLQPEPTPENGASEPILGRVGFAKRIRFRAERTHFGE